MKIISLAFSVASLSKSSTKMDYNLSPEEMQRVRECWKTLLERKDGLEAGMLMFVR